MSLYSAMYAGVSALQSQSSAMAAIGDNIANVSTIGYKDTDVDFMTLVTKQTSSTTYSSGGVMSKSTQNVSTQGTLSATTSTTDIALSGDGFFVVNSVAEPSNSQGLFAYTRAGSFSVDEDGYLVNTSGYYMMGWPLTKANGSEPTTSLIEVNGDMYTRAYTQSDGSLYYVNTNVIDNKELKALNINELGGTAEATLNIKLGANLPADDAVGSDVETTVSVYDALGITHNVDWTWTKTAANTWDLAVTPPSGSATAELVNATSASASGSNYYYASGQLEFTGDWDSTAGTGTVTDIHGIGFTVNGIAYTIDGTTAPVVAPVAGATTIYVNDATSWADVTAKIALQLNLDDMTAGAAVVGQFGTGATPTAYAAGAFNGTGGPNDDGTRFGVSSDGKSIVFTQSGNGTATTIGAFVDGTTDGVMKEYLVTSAIPAGTFTVHALDATGNYWGADANGDGDFADAGDVAEIAAVVFNGNGTPNTIKVTDMNIVWSNGANDMTGNDQVNLFFGNQNLTDGLTQLSSPYQVNYLSQDGAKFGNFAGIEISTDGVVTAMFDNGVRTPIFQIPVATFVNGNGMESLTGNVWIQTDSSGSYTLHIAGTAGAGTIHSGALETSTVDLATEFTTMIVTQRAYSAASKVITTANDMMDDLLSIVR